MAPKRYSDVGDEDDSDDRWDWESESIGEGSEDEQSGITIPPLLPIAASIAKPNDALCDICKGLDLHPRRFVVLPSDNEKTNKRDDPSIKLGLVKDIKKKVHCPFCRLVLTALGGDVPSEEDGEQVSVTMSWNTEGPIPDSNQPWTHVPQIRILRPYGVKEGGGYIHHDGGTFFPEITLLANDAPTSNKTFFVRLIHDQIDFAMVRNWLTMCETWHGAHCDESEMLRGVQYKDPATEIPQFRLIDVIDNCIVRAPPDCKYVTLSYVWGRVDPKTILRAVKSNIDDLEKRGSLLGFKPGYIPVTILDAMEVVRRLNMRYLWIDSLCIVQDDDGPGGSKMGSIAKMDLVYGGAYLTIMAATGNDANAGLPGLHPGTRQLKQPIEEISPGFRLCFKTKFQDFVGGATYYTRGWTFQEQQFTKRSLLFLGGQVVYRCRQADQWREDLVFESDQSLKYGGGLGGMGNDDNDIGQFEGLIQSYSGLSLTYETDIYNAFAGMMRYIKLHLKVNLCHGIPDAYFDWFLLWTPLKPQERRRIGPSWSWVGWRGDSWPHMWDWYSRNIKAIRRAIRSRTWIIWYQRKSHNSTEVERVWTPKKRSSTSTPRNFYGSHVSHRFSPVDCSNTIPTPRTLHNAPTYIQDTFNPSSGSGFLQFWTMSIWLKLDKPTSKEDLQSPLRMPTSSRIGVFGVNHRELGIVYVPSDWAKANVPKMHEFILLCEGRDVRADRGKIDEEHGWKYKTMLIEWHGNGEWAERVSISSIRKKDLKKGFPPGLVWKEIVLG